jgi:rubredoxin-NAD+ reductase
MDPIVILGAGLAGHGVAREFRRLDPATPVVMVAADDAAAYSKPMLSTALATKRGAAQLATASAAQVAAQLGIEIRGRTRVAAIDRGTRSLRLADGGRIGYAKLVLALGADPRRLDMAGDAAGKVMPVNDLDDYARFRAALEEARRVTILGAGLIGCEFANDIAATGRRVDVVDIARLPLGRLLPPRAATLLRDGLAARGVHWHLGRGVGAVRPAGGGIAIELDDGAVVETDVALSAVGLAPRIALAAAAGLGTGRGIRVDRRLGTTDPDIFALGDCAEVGGLVLPYVMPLMRCARALARTLAGTPTAVDYPAMPVVVKTPAMPVVVAPPPSGAAGDWEETEIPGGIVARFAGPDGASLGVALVGQGAVARKTELANGLPAWL